jgi:hypothetical protein
VLRHCVATAAAAELKKDLFVAKSRCCKSKPIRVFGQNNRKNPFLIELKIREKSSHLDTLQIKVHCVFAQTAQKSALNIEQEKSRNSKKIVHFQKEIFV